LYVVIQKVAEDAAGKIEHLGNFGVNTKLVLNVVIFLGA